MSDEVVHEDVTELDPEVEVEEVHEFDDEMSGEDPGVVDKADAKDRAFRTMVQGAAFAVILAVAQAVAALSGADVNWKLLGLTVLQAAATGLLSYVQRVSGK